MKKETRTIEEVLAQALQMQESGISTAEIYKAFPEEAKDLRSFFDTIEILKKQTTHITPSEDAFQTMLAALDKQPFAVRSPFTKSLWKNYGLMLSAGATLALVFVLQSKTPNTQVALENAPAPMAMTEVADTGALAGTETPSIMVAKMAPAPSGSVDDAISEINSSSSQETSYGKVARDKELAAYDKNDVNTFANTSYEELY
jgi:hypothetical protein